MYLELKNFEQSCGHSSALLKKKDMLYNSDSTMCKVQSLQLLDLLPSLLRDTCHLFTLSLCTQTEQYRARGSYYQPTSATCFLEGGCKSSNVLYFAIYRRFGDSQSQLRGLERTQILRLQILRMSFLAVTSRRYAPPLHA